MPSLIVAPNARMVIITQITERIGFVKKRAVLYINIEDIERDIHCSMNTPTFDLSEISQCIYKQNRTFVVKIISVCVLAERYRFSEEYENA